MPKHQTHDDTQIPAETSDAVEQVLALVSTGQSLTAALTGFPGLKMTAASFRRRAAVDPVLREKLAIACSARRETWRDGLIDIANELADGAADVPRCRVRIAVFRGLLATERESLLAESTTAGSNDGEENDLAELSPENQEFMEAIHAGGQINLKAGLEVWLRQQAEQEGRGDHKEAQVGET